MTAAKDAYPAWSSLPGHVRARHIYSLARHVQKHHRIFAGDDTHKKRECVCTRVCVCVCSSYLVFHTFFFNCHLTRALFTPRHAPCACSA